MVAGIAETDHDPEQGGGHAGWLDARGSSLAAATVDLGGWWPGADRAAGLLSGARLRLTDRHLVVDELRSRGFALPLDTLERASLLRRADGDLTAIGFRLRRETGSRRFWAWEAGGDRFRALRALAAVGEALPAAGVPCEDGLLPALPVEPLLGGSVDPGSVVWEGAVSVWSNPLTAPRRTTLRLTDDALVWDGRGGGMLRLDLASVREAAPLASGADRTAGLLLALAGSAGGSDLLVRLAAEPGSDGHLRRLAGLTHELRGRGVPFVTAAGSGTAQPWLVPASPSSRVWAVAPMAADPPAVRAFGRAEADDGPAAVPLAAAPEPSLGRVARYEAGALAVLAAIRRGERGAARRLIGESLAAALAELEEAVAAGVLAPAGAARRRERLLALNDAAVRFRALAELRAAGLVDDADYALKRGQVLTPLQERIFAGG